MRACASARACCMRCHVRPFPFPYRRVCSLHVLGAILSHPRGDVRTWLMHVCDKAGKAFTVRGLDESLQKLGARDMSDTNASLSDIAARPESEEVVRALARVMSLLRCGEVSNATDAHLLWALLAPDTRVAKVRRWWRAVRMHACLSARARSWWSVGRAQWCMRCCWQRRLASTTPLARNIAGSTPSIELTCASAMNGFRRPRRLWMG